MNCQTVDTDDVIREYAPGEHRPGSVVTVIPASDAPYQEREPDFTPRKHLPRRRVRIKPCGCTVTTWYHPPTKGRDHDADR